MFVRFRLPVLLLLATGIFTGGWWLGKNSAAGPAQRSAHSATAQLPPPSAHPPGYLTSKATPAPPAAGAEALAKLLEQRASPEDLATALAAWAEQDPNAAFRALLADPRLQRQATARALFEALGKNDPTQAVQRLAQLPAVTWARDANIGLAIGWTQRDPQAATTAGLALPTGMRRVDFLQTAFGQWAKQDIIAARDWVLALSPEGSRAHVLTGWAINESEIHNAQEMAALLDLARSNGLSYPNVTLSPFRTWITKSPDDALKWALALPHDGEKTSDFVETALQAFASDPARILLLLPQINDSLRDDLLYSAADAWALRDPTAGWAWADQHPDLIKPLLFKGALSQQWINADPDSALPWLLKNSPDSLAETSKEPISEWAKDVPEAALALLGQIADKNSMVNFCRDILEGIAAAQPLTALVQLDTFQSPSIREPVIQVAISSWSKQDITATTEYVAAMPPGGDRDMAIDGMSYQIFEENPESALTWAAGVSNAAKKEKLLNQYFYKWREKDPTAAQNWLDHAPLDDDLRQKLNPSLP